MTPWFLSRGMWGGILAVVLSSSGLALNINLETGEFSGNLYELGAQLGTMFGGLLAIWGRFHAKGPIATRRRRIRAYREERE